MELEMRLGGETAFKLEHAVLVYSDGKRAYATLHKPVQGRGAPSLGAGQPVTSAFLRALGDGLGAGLPLEVIPPTVLCRTPDVTVWWRPAQRAPLFYAPWKEVKHGDALKALSGRRVPQPPLVFKATRTQLWVRAIAGDDRPTASTPTYEAPYFNVSTTGAVCLGSMRRPTSRGIAAIAEWERAFFESEFTHALPGTRLTSFPGGFTKLWVGTAALGLDRFPDCALAPAPKKETLGQFLTTTEIGRM